MPIPNTPKKGKVAQLEKLLDQLNALLPWAVIMMMIEHYPAQPGAWWQAVSARSHRHISLYRQRQAVVEPVFSTLRGGQALNRFRRKGLAGVKVEFALHTMVLALFGALNQ